jgi:hypothetical protein
MQIHALSVSVVCYTCDFFLKAADNGFVLSEREDGKGAGDKENAGRANGPS